MTFFVKRNLAAAFVVSTGLVSLATAHTSTHGDMVHSAHMGEEAQVSQSQRNSILTEPGQGAFAALSEIVQVLEADPATDWTKVNLTALRDHLIDMDRLVRDAVAEEEVLPNGIRATVAGDQATLATAIRMVPAHAAELSKDDRWQVEAQSNDTDVVLTVTSDDPATVSRIQGLGFFGLMASQDHHRQHHLAFALGGSHGDGH